MAPPSVVLVVFDAMRKDSLPVYGGGSSTPNLDLFCAEGSVYRDCIAPGPWTIPSHASLFTGRFPGEHGVHESYERGLPETLGLMKDVDGLTLAEELRKKGYQTIGLPANSTLTLRPGFDRGFDWFKASETRLVSFEEFAVVQQTFEKGRGKTGTALHLLSRGQIAELWRLYSIYRRMNKARKLLDFPRSKGGNFLLETLSEIKLTPPFFLFVNFMETHEPYTAFEKTRSNLGPFTSVHNADLYEYKEIPGNVVGDLKQAYSGTVSRVDKYFGGLIAFLKRAGLYEGSLLIATSDHGQEFKEQGFYTHGTFLHDGIVKVPLVVKYPAGKKPAIEKGYQNLCDIHSLVLQTSNGEDASMKSSDATFSESFGVVHKPPLVNDPVMKAAFERVRQRVDIPRKAVFKDGYKLVVDWTTKNVEEFSLDGRQLEMSDKRNVADSLMDDLLAFEKREVRSTPKSAPRSADEEAVVSDRLRALGYL
ncbi:MAG TPA: sulfatase [Nitrososphaerales archaeon]|nr:sulfatase [Nitrososphaerales archaeon]